MNDINKETVEIFFSKAAQRHQNENAVLDGAVGQEHANMYRNYFTIDFIKRNLNPNTEQIILDFGCGVGRVTNALSSKSKKIFGVDSNQAMIDTAKRNFSKKKNIEYHLIANSKIPLPDNQFDIAFSNWVFQHISDDETILLLKELKRSLKPTGKIFLFEQIKIEKTLINNLHLFRTIGDYQTLFNRTELKIDSAYAVMRVPSRGMWLWNKLPSIKLLLPFVALIDKFTLNRKPELAEYFTYCFVLSK